MLEAALEGRGKGEFNATTHCGGGGGGRADMMAMKEEGGSKKRAPLGRGQGRIRGSTPQLPLHSAFGLLSSFQFPLQRSILSTLTMFN